VSGIKGRSGKITTPEQRLARIEAARAGGRAKAGRGAAVPTSTTGMPPAPFTIWPDYKDFLECELRKLKLVGEQIDNDTRQAKLDQERGRLLTRAQVEERDERADEIILGHLGTVAQFVGDLFPPEQGAAARSKALTWLSEVRARIAADLRTAR